MQIMSFPALCGYGLKIIFDNLITTLKTPMWC